MKDLYQKSMTMCRCCDGADLKIWTGNKKKMDFA